MLVNTLLSGPRRFGELMEALGNVSPKTVSQRLKMLEEIGFVQRQAFAEIPPRVEYRLTEKGLGIGGHHGGNQAICGALPRRERSAITRICIPNCISILRILTRIAICPLPRFPPRRLPTFVKHHTA